MKMTLNEYYNKVFTTYYMQFDNKGNFKEGKGIIPYGINKDAEKIIKKHITSRRKSDIFTEILYSNERKEISRIYMISKGKYNSIHIYTI